MSTPEWQLTMDVIKSKTNSLLLTNEKLMADHQVLTSQYKKLQNDIREEELKNESLKQLLKQRQGRSEQKMQTDELQKQIKEKTVQARQLQKDIDDQQKKLDRFERKVGQKKIKYSDMEVSKEKGRLKVVKKAAIKPAEEPPDEALLRLSQQLQGEKAQEEILKAQLDNLKQAFAAKQVVDDSKAKELQAKAAFLRKQKEDLQKQGNVDNNQVKLQQYQQLADKKKELEQKIKGFELELDQLKDPKNLGFLTGSRNKGPLRQMVGLDTLNIQLKQKIADMRQDIELLKQQVSRLERKAKFVKDDDAGHKQ